MIARVVEIVAVMTALVVLGKTIGEMIHSWREYRRSKKYLGALLLIAFLPSASHAVIRTADSCERGDVNAAVNGGTGPGGTNFSGAVTAGSIVNVPSGNCTWTSQ